MDLPAPVVVRSSKPGFRVDITAGPHALIGDEPKDLGGTGLGATPYDLLLAALGSCTAMTVRMYAKRRGWSLETVTVRLGHTRQHEQDCEQCEEHSVGIPHIDVQLELTGDLDHTARTRLRDIAQRCPVKQSLERGIEVYLVPE